MGNTAGKMLLDLEKAFRSYSEHTLAERILRAQGAIDRVILEYALLQEIKELRRAVERLATRTVA